LATPERSGLAEGFGLVPYEAARFGTPTIHVDFGPFKDHLIGGLAAESWEEESILPVLQQVLDDPVAADVAVRDILSSGERLTWERTAERLVEEYLRSLGMPTRRRH
jgi:glycosyltransferase involved in cell wall biosynthesis